MEDKAALNTDRDLWREPPGDYYAHRVFLTEGGGIGMDAGGHCIVKTIKSWNSQARQLFDAVRALESAPELPEQFPNPESIAEWVAEYAVWWKTRMRQSAGPKEIAEHMAMRNRGKV